MSQGFLVSSFTSPDTGVASCVSVENSGGSAFHIFSFACLSTESMHGPNNNEQCECDDEDALHGRHVEMENLIV
ncbi:hypothetical protein WN944_017817 [Citrus x changshan-huyou]|uniref:Uncharacterized protein n=1 Tax=Citrus x changshan-huyou TaxID=2935761 RepID=A0AAP0MIA1_9ROSI